MRADTLTNRLLEKNIIKEEDAQIYRFGMECLAIKAVTFLSYVVIALVMAKLKDFAIIMLVFVPLRKAAGGFHAKTKMRCYLLSCGLLAAALFLCRGIVNLSMWTAILGIMDIAFLWMAPIDHENKRMDEEEICFFRKRTRVRLLLVNAACVVLAVLGFDELFRAAVLGEGMSFFLLVSGKLQAKR
ncbi:MAG: accessory gene regulator B family protein [Lachnospiraceae bacterium]